MKRTTMHWLFLSLAACLLAITLWQAYKLYNNRQLITAIKAVPASIKEHNHTVAADAHDGVLLATANAMSAGGQFESAETLFVKVADKQNLQPLGQASRYNLANHYLRQGLRKDLPGEQTRPLIEIAKQRYRDLLLTNPDDWDARVNLEVALRASPELTGSARGRAPPIKSVNVIVPDFTLKDLP